MQSVNLEHGGIWEITVDNANAVTQSCQNSKTVCKSSSNALSSLSVTPEISDHTTAKVLTPSCQNSKPVFKSSPSVLSPLRSALLSPPLTARNANFMEIRSTENRLQNIRCSKGNITFHSSDQNKSIGKNSNESRSNVTNQSINDGYKSLHSDRDNFLIRCQQNESLEKDVIITGVTKPPSSYGASGMEVNPLLQYAQTNILQTDCVVCNINCSVCYKSAYFLCSNCLAYWYCSPECQIKHWAIHQMECMFIPMPQLHTNDRTNKL